MILTDKRTREFGLSVFNPETYYSASIVVGAHRRIEQELRGDGGHPESNTTTIPLSVKMQYDRMCRGWQTEPSIATTIFHGITVTTIS